MLPRSRCWAAYGHIEATHLGRAGDSHRFLHVGQVIGTYMEYQNGPAHRPVERVSEITATSSIEILGQLTALQVPFSASLATYLPFGLY